MAREFPKTMFHATQDPKVCHTPDEVKKLGPGWYDRYIYREYPKFMYGEEGPIKVYDKAEEDAKLAAGYSNAPLPEKPKPLAGQPAPGFYGKPGEIDPETFQKIQTMEFEILNLNEQMSTVIGAVSDLRIAHEKLIAELSEPAAAAPVAPKSKGKAE